MQQLVVRPWGDGVLDEVGHDARSVYVERFWLGLLGPSATWFLRRCADQFDEKPQGFILDVENCSASLGLSRNRGPTGTFPRMLARCCHFHVARVIGPEALEVRRTLAPLNAKQIDRLAPALQVEHRNWVDSTPAMAEVAELSDRSRRLALTLLQLGETPAEAEKQLHRWRFHPALAREAVGWAKQRRATTESAEAGAPVTQVRSGGDVPSPESGNVDQSGRV